jgi:hypothetical protein
MKYDILLNNHDDEQRDIVIESYFHTSINPYIFGKLDLEKSLLILTTELVEYPYYEIKLVPRLDNDQINIFELVKSPKIIATIEGDWTKDTAIHLLRIKKCCYDSNYNLLEKINFMPEIIAIDNDQGTSELVDEFIQYTHNHIQSLERKIYRRWKDLIRSYLSFKEAKVKNAPSQI